MYILLVPFFYFTEKANLTDAADARFFNYANLIRVKVKGIIDGGRTIEHVQLSGFIATVALRRYVSRRPSRCINTLELPINTLELKQLLSRIRASYGQRKFLRI